MRQTVKGAGRTVSAYHHIWQRKYLSEIFLIHWWKDRSCLELLIDKNSKKHVNGFAFFMACNGGQHFFLPSIYSSQFVTDVITILSQYSSSGCSFSIFLLSGMNFPVLYSSNFLLRSSFISPGGKHSIKVSWCSSIGIPVTGYVQTLRLVPLLLLTVHDLFCSSYAFHLFLNGIYEPWSRLPLRFSLSPRWIRWDGLLHFSYERYTCRNGCYPYASMTLQRSISSSVSA